jgi:hypoxanthine phosphoribosyltransferase
VGESADFQADSVKEPPRFQNEAERECAKVLDFYGVPWEYEPHTFVLEEDVMKQRLVTRKNRKLRRLREQYPDVNVKLFYKRDIERLAQRYRLDLAS